MKYHNKKITIDGIKFDSKFEAKRYEQLKVYEKLGMISSLKMQVPFILQDKFKYKGKTIRSIKYIADFVYYDNETNKIIIEDTKGFRTDIYNLKKKLLFKILDENVYEFKEINLKKYR